MLLAMSPTLELVNTFAQVGSLLIFVATAIAALKQIRHLRASNELEALLRLTEKLRGEALQSAFRFVQTELDARLADPAYRAELVHLGYIDAHKHPEMDACNWFNEIGTLVKNRLIDERTFLDLFARLVTYYWDRLEPVIALVRRERGDAQYENFEYLALLGRRWRKKHPNGTYPANAARLAIVDAWHEIDMASVSGR